MAEYFEYFCYLLNGVSKEKDKDIVEHMTVKTAINKLSINEISEVIMALKNHKAPAHDHSRASKKKN